METLYRKYRPQLWEDLTGQDHVKLTLEKALILNKLAHAFLFAGPKGSGKTSAARLLAKALNCEKRSSESAEPCNGCSSCQEISLSRSLDVMEIDAASNTGVDNVRENIIDTARLSPTKSKHKIFIIDEVHMLSASAFNALLKIIEEPPAHVFFILATTEPFKIPPTILSRCQRFDFKKVELAKIKEKLKRICLQENIEIENKILERIAHQSDGCLRDAENLLGQILALGEKKITEKEASLILPRSNWKEVFSFLELLINGEAGPAIILINQLVENGLDLFNFTEDLISAARFLLLTKLNTNLNFIAEELEEEELKKLHSLAPKTEANFLGKIIEIFIKQKAHLRSTHIPQLPIEVAVVEICSSLNSAPLTTQENTPTHLSKKETIKTNPPKTAKVEKIELETTSETLTVETENNALTPINITFETIKEKWEVFLKKVQEYNHSLPFILKMGQPQDLHGKILRISFRYTFHKDKINEHKIKTLAEKALNDVLGGNLVIEGVYSPEENIEQNNELKEIDKTPEKVDNGLVSNLIESFGGQLAE